MSGGLIRVVVGSPMGGSKVFSSRTSEVRGKTDLSAEWLLYPAHRSFKRSAANGCIPPFVQERANGPGDLAFFGDLEHLARADAFAAWLAPFRKSEWVVYCKPLFDGPEAVLAYLSRYTHRVAISNHRLVSADADTVAFR